MSSRPPFELPAADASQPRGTDGPSWHEISQTRRGGRLSPRGRALLYAAIILLACVGTMTWHLAQRGQDIATATLADATTALARSLSAAFGDERVDRRTLELAAKAQLSGQQVLAVAYVDNAGVPIAWAGKDGVSAIDFRSSQSTSPQKAKTPAGEALVVSTPITRVVGDQTSTLGEVIVVTSLQSVTRGTEATFALIGLVGGGVSVAAALLIPVMLVRSRKPLKDLVTSVRSVIAGKVDSLTEDRDNDQVAELAIAFNELIRNLRTNRAQLATANEELASLIRGLEQKIADRTAQFEAANERLSAEIAEKEDFLRAVSHDLNAPLRNISGMVSMLMTKNKDSLPADVVNRLERIRKNVDVEADLINELLELSRIKTRRQRLELVDTEALLWDLRGMFENDLKTRHIDVILETSLPSLYAERARIRQIFQNLIDNAIKYMGDGPVREIRIGCAVTVTGAAFYVRDTGLGIHPEDIDKVFFVFRRGRGEVCQKVAGKGVGLSSVKSIVETYAGEISVESTLGEGATFRFTINGKYVPSVAGQPPAEMGEQASQPTPTLAPVDTSENRAA